MDLVNCFEHEQTDYSKFDALLEALHITELELFLICISNIRGLKMLYFTKCRGRLIVTGFKFTVKKGNICVTDFFGNR